MTEPRRGRRARERTVGPGQRAAGVVLILITLVVGTWINRFTPLGDDGLTERAAELQRSFVTSGEAGSTVEGKRFSVLVHGVRGAARIEGENLSGAQVRTTTGLWLVADVTATARTEHTLIGFAALRDEEGRLFYASGRVRQPLVAGRDFQPGIPVRGELVFEVPQSVAAQELTLVMARTTYGQRFDSVVEVTLPAPPEDRLATWRRASSAPPVARS